MMNWQQSDEKQEKKFCFKDFQTAIYFTTEAAKFAHRVKYQKKNKIYCVKVSLIKEDDSFAKAEIEKLFKEIHR